MSYLQAATLFALTALVSAVEVAQAAVPTELTYMGRLIDATGKPLAGPIDLEASFYRAADGGDAVGGTVLEFPGVTLNKGVFQIDLKLTDSEMNVIFDNSSDVYVQIVDKTNHKTYSRQKYGVVPYALKVPTDNSTIVYDSSGRLTLGKRPSVGFTTSTSGTVYLKPGTGSADGLTYTLPASPVAGQFLTTDATGTLSWTPMASVAISSLPTGVNANQIPLLGTGGTLPAVDGSLLTNLNASHLSTASLNLSTSTAVAGTLPIALGGTGLASTPTNGQILVGNGTGFTLSNIAAGTGMNVTNAAGTITIAAAADASLMVKKDGTSQLTGPWNVGGQDITNTGSMALAASKTLGLGTYAVDPTLTAADKGKIWFNSATGQMKYWDGAAAQSLGISGAGLTSLNSQTGSSQTFAAGSTGTAPAISSSANVHTLNVPFASASGVTAGVISNTDYTAFNGKQAAGNYLTALTGDISAAGPGSGAATLANSGVTAGSYTKFTVDAKGRVTAGTTLAAADIPTLSTAIIGSGTLSVANGGTGVGTFANNSVVIGGSMLSGLTGTTGQVLTLDNSNAPTFGKVNLGATAAITGTLPVANGGSGLTATPTNGQILVGNGTGFTLSNLIAGSGITVANTAGTITVSASGGSAITALTGDLTASGTGSVSATLANSGVAAGTYAKMTVDAKGRVTAGGTLAATDLPVFSAALITSGTLAVANGGTGVTTSTGTGSVVLGTSPTLTTPLIGTIVNTGTLTLPTATDTLVGRTTTDTLTNKTLTTPKLTGATKIQPTADSTTAMNFATSAGTSFVVMDSTNSRVAIGTTTAPVSTLDVFGGISAGSYAGVNAAPTNGLIISGNLGIGTTAPAATLDVKGKIASSSTGTPVLSG